MSTPHSHDTHASPADTLVDTNKLVAERREKLAAIRAQGVAFPNDFKPADRAGALHAAHDGTEAEALEAQAVKASVGGRLMLKRVMGKACFGTLQDATGRIQVYVTLDNVGA
ncbi:MAG: lysine--tRNA ligase, partial [Aquabacterium sp.]